MLQSRSEVPLARHSEARGPPLSKLAESSLIRCVTLDTAHASLISTAGFLRIFSESKPEKEFAETPDAKVIKRVQADLEELRVTVRGNERSWLRVGSEPWWFH